MKSLNWEKLKVLYSVKYESYHQMNSFYANTFTHFNSQKWLKCNFSLKLQSAVL